MGTLFRSEEMQLVQLFVQVEAAHDTVDELGKMGLVQFRDLNTEVSAFQRNFVNEVKRCEEMLRKIRFFEEQIQLEKTEILSEKTRDKESHLLLVTLDEPHDVKPYTLNDLETRLEELEKEILDMKGNQEMLNRNYNELIEMKHVLTKDGAFFAEMGDGAKREEKEKDERSALLDKNEGAKAVRLGFLTGVIRRDKFASFERVLWRSTRGNLFMKHSDIEDLIKDPQTEELLEKCVFIIFYQGERAQMKIKKICESFGANTYQIPENQQERRSFLGQVESRLHDLVDILVKSRKQRRQVLADISRQLNIWKEKVTKEIAIYSAMNLFNYDVGRKCLIAEGWTPKTATDKIVGAMRRATESSGALVPSILSVVKAHEEPPTYFRTNKFTQSFQSIIDAYGIAHYREVNPGVFTIITFPFLFAVMFGDFGHGILLTLTALLFIKKEKQLSESKLNEMIDTPFQGRYLLLLMGLFSIYTGLIYNECFSVGMNIFGTRWSFPENATELIIVNNTYVNVSTHATFSGSPYPFGVDPAWNGASNMLDYYNSLKMKMSIVFGVTHMMGGIFLSLLNAVYFGHGIDIIGEFIPQTLFMGCLFGYMVFLIVFKWLNPVHTPLILQVMIFMFLSPYEVPDDNVMYDKNIQFLVQLVLIIVALGSVPCMLFIKPLYLRSKHNARMANKVVHHEQEDHHDDDEEFEFGEIFIKQVIHTIEFVLGAISNTASYLRLWALSLAHSELSAVFWERIFLMLFGMAANSPYLGGVLVFAGFAIWAAMTVGVLMVMESLSAFLHALRLHWVEFQNKFYHGDGHLFVPFSYERILKGEDAQE